MVEGRYPSDDLFRGDFDPQVRKKKSAAAKSIERRATASKSPRSQLKRGLALLAGKTEELPKELLRESSPDTSNDDAKLASEVPTPATRPRPGRVVRILASKGDSSDGSADAASDSPASPWTRRLFGRTAHDLPMAGEVEPVDAADAGSAGHSSIPDLFAAESPSEGHEKGQAERSGPAFFEEDEPAYMERRHRFFSRSHAEAEPHASQRVTDEFDGPVQNTDDFVAEPTPAGLSGSMRRFFSQISHAPQPEDRSEPPVDEAPVEIEETGGQLLANDSPWFSKDRSVAASHEVGDQPPPSPQAELTVSDQPDKGDSHKAAEDDFAAAPTPAGLSASMRRFFTRVAKSLRAEDEPTNSMRGGSSAGDSSGLSFESDLTTPPDELTDLTATEGHQAESRARLNRQPNLDELDKGDSHQAAEDDFAAAPTPAGLSASMRRFFSQISHALHPEGIGAHSGMKDPRAGREPETTGWITSGDSIGWPGPRHKASPAAGTVGMPAALSGMLEAAKRFFFRVEEIESGAHHPASSPDNEIPRAERFRTGIGVLGASAARLGRSILAEPEVASRAGAESSLEASQPGTKERSVLVDSETAVGRAAATFNTPARRPRGRHFAGSGTKWEPPKWALDAESDALPPVPSGWPAIPVESDALPPVPSGRPGNTSVHGRAPSARTAETSQDRANEMSTAPRSPRRSGSLVSSRAPILAGSNSGALRRTSRETVAMVISVCLILAIVLGIGNLRGSNGIVAGKSSSADLAPSTTVVTRAPTTTVASIPVTTAPSTTVVVTTTTTTTQPKLAAGANPANAQVTVRVANGTGVAGAAGRITQKLQSLDFNVVVPINATVSNLTKTTVYYYAGFQVAGQAIAEILGLPASAAKPLTSTAPLPNIYPSDVNVVLGADIAG